MITQQSQVGIESHSAEWWNQFWADQDKDFGTPRPELINRVKAHVEGLEFKAGFTVADVGSGNGRYAIPFAKLGFITTVLERSPAGCRVIEQRAAHESVTDTLKVVEVDILDTDKIANVAPKGFDAVFSSGLIEEIDPSNQLQAVANTASLVKNGGLLVLKYCLEIQDRGKTVAENFVPPLFLNDASWLVESVQTDDTIRDSIANIDFENKIRTETIIATKLID